MKMTRDAAIEALRSAGARGDQQAFLRIYTEQRISLAVAQQAYREGERFAAAVGTPPADR